MKEQLALVLGSDPPRRARTAVLRSAFFRSSVPVEDALARDAIAGRQEGDVLAVFRSAADDADEDDFDAARLTPSQVLACLQRDGGRAPLLTSVRRAISNLTARKRLVHHETDRRPGPFGAKESTWSLRT